MHELSLSHSLVGLIEEQSRLQSFLRVRTVTVELGCLGHVDAQALRFCFDLATRETVAEGSRLIIVDRPARLACAACGEISEVTSRIADCPACGSARVMVEGGDELKLTELEVD